jgi:hypothetical protein
MYSFLVAKKVNFPYKSMWTLKLPLRIKVFCWLVIKNRILTKENLKKKGWKKVELREFCDDHETEEHLFFLCPLAKYIWNVVSVSLGISKIPECFVDLYRDWFNMYSGRDRKAVIVGSVAVVWTIWKTRNKSCFQKIRPGDPTSVITLVCHFINTWSNMQKNGLQKLCYRGLERWRM